MSTRAKQYSLMSLFVIIAYAGIFFAIVIPNPVGAAWFAIAALVHLIFVAIIVGILVAGSILVNAITKRWKNDRSD